MQIPSPHDSRPPQAAPGPETIIRFLERRAVFAALAVLTALLTTVAYFNTTREFPFGSILRVTLGVADPPFQGRILTYAVAREVSTLFSVNLYAVHFFLRLAVIVAALYALRALVKALGYRSGFLFLLFPLSVLFSFAVDYHYPTDFTEILFFSLMLWLAAKNRWPWLLPVFGLAFLNRESAVLFLPFLGLHLVLSKKWKTGILYLGALALLAVGLWLFVLPEASNLAQLAGHPNKLASNLAVLKSLPLVFSGGRGEAARAFLWRLLSFSGFMYAAYLLMRKRLPLIVRRYMLCVFPLCLMAALFVGNLDETRVFYPLLPAFIAAGVAFLERMGKAAPAAAAALSVLLVVMFIKGGPLPKSGADFFVKAAAFRAEEFGKWEMSVREFSSRQITIRGDQAVIDLSSVLRKFYFLDAAVIVTSPPNDPVPLSCRFTLESGYSHVESFWKEPGAHVSISRHINLEMDHPAFQTESLQKVTLRFDRSLEGATPPVISWRGFSGPKEPPH